MKILIFGATGMVGQGVLRECLGAGDVERTVALGRTATGAVHARFANLVHGRLDRYQEIEGELAGFDACFFCLGVSSAGMGEAEYTRITYGYTLAAAEALSGIHPGMKFVYVSGQGTDSSERGRAMWARVKGRVENALLRLPLETYLFRPGFIEPMDGIRSRTRLYQAMYDVTRPLFPLARRLFPNQVVTTRQIGQAMLGVARRGYAKRILDPGDIRRAAEGGTGG